jgi:hypothetical protein
MSGTDHNPGRSKPVELHQGRTGGAVGMIGRSMIVCGGVIVGAILLGTQGACLAGSEVGPPDSATLNPPVDESNPYAIISDRNVFHLNPPPAPPPPDNGPPAVIPKVYLSGFMRTGDRTKALLVVRTQNPDPRAKELCDYLTLGEGNIQGVVELVKVDAEEHKVEIINSGTAMTLSLKDNGVKPEAAPQPPPSEKHAAPTEERPPLLRRGPGSPHNPKTSASPPGSLATANGILNVKNR